MTIDGMSRKLCVIHANCQGDPLRALLMNHPQFGRQFSVVKYTNYLRETVLPEHLAECDLFLYQPLGEQWDDHASDALLARVNPRAVTLALPNMFFKGYWPFWTNKSPMNYGDSLLDELIAKGLEVREIVYLYVHSRLVSGHDLAGMFADSVAYERRKEEGCVVGTVDIVLEHFRTERLFNTINHPNRRLVLHVANGLLNVLGFPPLPSEQIAAFPDPYPECELPIHPQVAAFHDLRFAGPDTRYNVYGTPRTFAEYAALYVDCRKRGISDFISFLHLV